MSVLEVVLDYATYELTESISSSHTAVRPVRFHSAKSIHEAHSYVFSGKITLRASNSDSEVDVICKLVFDDISRLAHEAEVYTTKLAELQGSVVPRFYGYYVGSFLYYPGRTCAVACMLLEPCGGPAVELLSETCRRKLRYAVHVWPFGRVRSKSDNLPAYSLNVMNAMIKIDVHGVQHNDFSARNVLASGPEEDARVSIIDFEDATSHVCERNLRIKMHTYPPNRVDFNCDELFNIAPDYYVWTPRTYTIEPRIHRVLK